MTEKMAILALAFLPLFIIGLGCGSSGGSGGMCAEPRPACTGDPVGTWEIDSICGYRPYDCPEATSNASAHQTEGALILDQSGTGSLNMNIEFRHDSTIPQSCTTSCEDLDDTVGGCDERGSNCFCDGEIGIGHSSSFSWAASAGNVTLTRGTDAAGWICVTQENAYYHSEEHLFIIFRRAP